MCALCRRRSCAQWDTAAADIIVREAGGVVYNAGKVTSKGELLEDWKVRRHCVTDWFLAGSKITSCGLILIALCWL